MAFELARKNLLSLARDCGDFAHFTRNLDLHGKKSLHYLLVRTYFLPLIHLTRRLPTLEVFSVIWEHTFQHCQRRNWLRLLSFFEKSYFKRAMPAEVKKMGHMTLNPATLMELLVGLFHTGVFCMACGTASGTQSMEAFNSVWQRNMPRGRVPVNPWTTIRIIMRLMRWSTARNGMMKEAPRSVHARVEDERFFRVDGLLTLGEPSAVDLHNHRHVGNHIIIQSRAFKQTAYVIFNKPRTFETLSPQEGAPDAPAAAEAAAKAAPSRGRVPLRSREFGPHRVRRRQRSTGVSARPTLRRRTSDATATHPAAQPVHETDAQNLVAMLDATDDALKLQLVRMGVLPRTTDQGVNLQKLKATIDDFVVVIVGGRAVMQTRAEHRDIICTCDRYNLRGGVCQHSIFVSSLNIPEVRASTRALGLFDAAAAAAAAACP